MVTLVLASLVATAQTRQEPDGSALDDETLRHFQALVRMDTSDPPGHEQPAAKNDTRGKREDLSRPGKTECARSKNALREQAPQQQRLNARDGDAAGTD